MAVRVGFEPLRRPNSLQVMDYALPKLPEVPLLPPLIARHCTPTDRCSIALAMRIAETEALLYSDLKAALSGGVEQSRVDATCD